MYITYIIYVNVQRIEAVHVDRFRRLWDFRIFAAFRIFSIPPLWGCSPIFGGAWGRAFDHYTHFDHRLGPPDPAGTAGPTPEPAGGRGELVK